MEGDADGRRFGVGRPSAGVGERMKKPPAGLDALASLASTRGEHGRKGNEVRPSVRPPR